MLKLAAIVGPTAVGKTNISIEVAQKIGGDILSCDSMQIYNGMDIGTAKVNDYERSLVPHHLINIVNPNIDFTVADYQEKAKELINSLNEQNKIPILVGGTGLYYQSVVDNYYFFPVKAQQSVRQKWENEYKVNGLDYLYNKLKIIDSEYASKISDNDKKRIIRALEVYDLTGKPFSTLQLKQENTYDLSVVGLYLDRKCLYEKIDERVDNMINEGLIEEVSELTKQGYDLKYNSMQALGYKQVIYYLEGMLTRQEMIKEIKRETRRYAKRQYTWFNKDKRINWINVEEYIGDDEKLVKKIISYMEGLLCRV